MSEPPAKRRKMRPNNAIALGKAKIREEKIRKTEAQKNTNAAKDNTKKNGLKQAEKKTAEKRALEKSSKEKTKVPATKKSKKEKSSAQTSEKPAIPKLSSPTPIPYTSASDSDETDNESQALYAKKNSAASIKKPSASTSASQLSTPDSDETDKESKRPAQKKPAKKQQKPAHQELSASDSDDTDIEVSRKRSRTTTSKHNNAPKSAAVIYSSDSDSSQEQDTPQQQQEQSDSDSDSSSDEDDDNEGSSKPSKKQAKRKADHLVANRISFRRKNEYNDQLSAANNVKGRLNDLFVGEVNENYFISDSDSETDSGEDYDAREYPSWQHGLGDNRNKEKDPWPKQRKFGYSDKLKLEKRIKKICRRDGITFSHMQEIVSSSHRAGHVRFFQKIGKAFPDVSLYRLAKTCKEMYHEKRNYGPWTKAEIRQLNELVKIYGRNATAISEHMNRSPKNINDYLYNHTSTEQKISKRWSKEEDALLAKAAAKYKKDDERMNFAAIEPLFKGTRTQKQIHARYYNLKHRIQPDGTLAEVRKANPYEELKYLKSLLEQVREHRLVEESQVDYTKNRGFVDKKFYLRARANIKGFEKMGIKDILKKLIEKQNQIIQSRREEKLLGSDPDADDDEDD